LNLSQPQRAMLQYLDEEGHAIIKIRHKLYVDHAGANVPDHTVDKLLALGLIERHPYTLKYQLSDAAKKYLQNP
jgi:hypothetical protein